MDILEAKYDLSSIELCNIFRNLLEMPEDFKHVSSLHVLDEHVHDSLVLSHTVHFQNQWVVQLSHQSHFIVNMTLVLLSKSPVFRLKFDSIKLLLCWLFHLSRTFSDQLDIRINSRGVRSFFSDLLNL